MKKVNAMEMRSIDGGYAVKCTFCGKTAKGLLPIGVTVFKLNHGHFGKGKTVWYSYGGRSGSKWWH